MDLNLDGIILGIVVWLTLLSVPWFLLILAYPVVGMALAARWLWSKIRG